MIYGTIKNLNDGRKESKNLGEMKDALIRSNISLDI